MVTPSDPYQFIFSESIISSSQEEILNRIPGWDDAKLNDSFTPSQPPLAASQQQDLKLWCSANSGSEDASSQEEPSRILLGVQVPMEWASPDTEQEKDGESYNAAFESDRSQSPNSLRQCYGPIMEDLFSDRFITQSQVATENLFESQPSASKDMAQCLKMDETLAKLQGAKAGEPVVYSRTKEDDIPFKIRELGLASNSLVPIDMKGQRDNEKISCARIHRKKTAVKNCHQSLQPEEPSHSPRNPDLYSPVKAAERCIDMCAGANRNAGTSIDERGHAKEHEDLIFEDTDGKRSDMAVKMLEDSVHVRQTSFEDLTNLKNKSTFCVSDLDRGENGRKRITEEGKLGAVVSMQKTKALKYVNRNQGQTERSSEAAGNQELPAIVKKVTCQEIQQSQVIKQLGETANEDSLKNVSVDISELQQTTCSTVSPEFQGLGRSSATEHKCTTRKTEQVARGESCLGHSGNNKQCAKGKDFRIFPESVIDVVMLRSGCLPACKPDDPDLLSLVIGSGVSLPLPVRRGKLQ